MLTKDRIEQFYKDVELLELKRPNAAITKATGFSKGNVSDYLNRKKEPSENFLDKFYKAFHDSFQNVPREKKHINGVASLAPEGQSETTYLKSLLEEKEARRRETEERAKRAEGQNDLFVEILKTNLNVLVTNSGTTLKYLEKILLVDRVEHEAIMESQDRQEHQPVGTNARRAGKRELDAAAGLQKTGKSNRGGARKSRTGA